MSAPPKARPPPGGGTHQDTIRSPIRLYKAPTDYTKPQPDCTKPQKDHGKPRQTLQSHNGLYKELKILDEDLEY